MYKDNLNKLISLLKEKSLKISFAESITAGMIASTFCEIPGTSEFMEFSAVTYSNRFKQKLLNVSKNILDENGPVSFQCVRAMAEGIIEYSNCDVAIAVSGYAGPDPKDIPVGTVWVCCVESEGGYIVKKLNLEGSRNEIRKKTVNETFKIAINFIQKYC